MAALTPAARKSLIAKAEKAETKSAGIRSLLEAGLTVAEVRTELGLPYGFVYGVALRAGLVTPAAREPKAKAVKAAAKAPAAKASTAKPAPRAKAALASKAKAARAKA